MQFLVPRAYFFFFENNDISIDQPGPEISVVIAYVVKKIIACTN